MDKIKEKEYFDTDYTAELERQQYRLAQLLSEEQYGPHNVGGLLRVWKECYTEHQQLMLLDCEIHTEYDNCVLEYVKTTIFNFISAFTALSDYLIADGATDIYIKTEKIGRSIFVSVKAKTDVCEDINKIESLGELRRITEDNVPPLLEIAYSCAAKARAILGYKRSYNGEVEFELEFNYVDSGALGFKSVTPLNRIRLAIAYVGYRLREMTNDKKED